MNRQQFAHMPTDIINLIVGHMLKLAKVYEDEYDLQMMFAHLYLLKVTKLPEHVKGYAQGTSLTCRGERFFESEISIDTRFGYKSQAFVFGHEVGHVIIDSSPNLFAHRLRSKFAGDNGRDYSVILEEIVDAFAVKWVTREYVYPQVIELLKEVEEKGKIITHVSGYCRMPDWA